MAINEDTYLVILDKVSDLPGDKLVELYHSGVTIGFANPKKAEIDALYQEYPDLGYYCNDDDIDRALLFAISSFNNGSYIIPDPEKFKEQAQLFLHEAVSLAFELTILNSHIQFLFSKILQQV